MDTTYRPITVTNPDTGEALGYIQRVYLGQGWWRAFHYLSWGETVHHDAEQARAALMAKSGL